MELGLFEKSHFFHWTPYLFLAIALVFTIAIALAFFLTFTITLDALALSVAIVVTIEVAFIFAIAVAIPLASLDIALFVCHPRHPHHCSLCHCCCHRCSPTTLFAVSIALAAITLFATCHFCCRLSTLLSPAAVPCCQPSPVAVVTLFSRPSITFAACINGWLLHSLHARQHTD